MAWVLRVIGDCPKCGAKDSFGNIDVHGTYVLRGCKRCSHREHIGLPPLKKKIVYLDQSFFSSAFRANDQRFVDAAERIAVKAVHQLLVAPYSSIHEDETHQWSRRDELFGFIKSTARGHEFAPAYEVDQRQMVKAFRAWMSGGPASFSLETTDALTGRIHEWDSYMRIDVGRYMGDIDLIRKIKVEVTDTLLDMFDGWRKSTATYEADVDAEHKIAAETYLKFYVEYIVRMAQGDYAAFLDAPIMSMALQKLMFAFSQEEPHEERWKKILLFLNSDHFKQTPYHDLTAKMFATLKASVRAGAYANREKSRPKLTGFFDDVKHIATYGPYCDAIFVDQMMAELISKPTIGLEKRYSVKVFSAGNWDAFLDWLDALEADMSDAHREGLAAAYPT